MFDRGGTVDGWFEEARAPERYLQWAGGAIGIGQLALAMTGLWALVSYTVERRTSEIGVRLALGASPSRLVAQTLRPAAVLIVAGITIGSLAGLIGGTIIRASTSGLGPLDLALVLPVGAILSAVAAIGAWLPARRIVRIDPASALRHE